MQLRQYQIELIENIKKSIKLGNKTVLAILGCGGGKSIIQADIAKHATDKNNHVLFLVHREELQQQIYNTFKNHDVNFNLCDVFMVQTVCKKLKSLPKYDLIITDEAHHSTANSYIKIYDYYPDAIKLGFTATPIRLNRGGLGDVYSDMVKSVTTEWLISNNFLSPYKYYSVQLADTSKIHIINGEYDKQEVARLMQDKKIYGNTVKQWEKFAKDKKTIIYCASVEASKTACNEFLEKGYNCISLDGKTSKNERKEAVEAFRRGEVNIMCNCDLFGEGFDIPDCECVVLLRPTQSLSLYIQQSMRAMRYMPNKTAIIIDHCGNCYTHGLPDDNREWSLEPKHKQENIVKIRVCKNCYAAYPPNLAKCPLCGEEATREIRKTNKKVVEIDLVELKRQNNIKNTKLCNASLKTWDEIVEFQKLHKYKFAWCLRYADKNGIAIPPKYNYMKRIIGI